MGLPTETDEDLAGIANLAYKVLDLHRDITGKRNGSVTVSVSFFVPKTHSPYQWYGQQDVEEIHRKQRYLKSLINNRNISYLHLLNLSYNFIIKSQNCILSLFFLIDIKMGLNSP